MPGTNLHWRVSGLKRSRLVPGWRLLGVMAVPILVSACSLPNPFATASPSPSPVATPVTQATPSAVSNQGSTSAASRLPVAQDLTFDGAISGHVDKAVTSCGGANGQWNAALIADVGAVHLTINMTLVADKGPGNYNARNDDGTINIAIHTPALNYLGSTGGFVVADDHRSGSVDAVFVGGLHLTGKWLCAST